MSDNPQKKPGILKGAAWVGSSRMLIRFLGLCSTFVLARLLVPADFGLVAIATGLIGVLQAFSEFGFNQALIRFKDADDDDYSTAWTLNVCRGMLICLILLALAHPLSLSLNDKRLFLVVLVISVLPLIRGLENPRLIAFEKELRFDVIFKVMVFTKVLGVAATISLAFIWRTYWVLIAGMILTDIARTSLSYYYSGGKIRFTIQRWRKLFGFSGWIFASQILKGISQRLDPLILAAYSTPHVVGVLHVARDLSNMTFSEVAAPLRRVLFPALSNLPVDSKEFLDIYQQSLKGLFIVLAPICVGFALTVPDVIILVLGNQWSETIRPIQFILSFLTFSILGQMAHSAIMAKGESRPLFIQRLFISPIKLIVYTISVAYFGLNGAVFAICFDLCLKTVTDLFISMRATQMGFFQHFSLIYRTLIPLLMMALVVSFFSYFVYPEAIHIHEHILRLLGMVGFGVFVYTTSSFCVWHFSGRPKGPEAILINLFNNILYKTKQKILTWI